MLVAISPDPPLVTLHYVFLFKELLITMVIEDVREEVSNVFKAAEIDAGLDQAIRRGLKQLVVNDPELGLMRTRPRRGCRMPRSPLTFGTICSSTPCAHRPAKPGPMAGRGLHPDRGRVVPTGRQQRR